LNTATAQRFVRDRNLVGACKELCESVSEGATGETEPKPPCIYFLLVAVVIIICGRAVGRESFDFRRNLRAALLGEFHNQGQVLARAPRRSLVAFLTKDHILSGKATDFNQQLAGRAALRAAIKQPAVSAAATFRHSARRPDVFFASVFARAPLIYLSALFGGQVETGVVSHFFLRSQRFLHH
jgi:hypothetical protein